MARSYIPLAFISPADNLKAVYQRARAHSALCNEDEARRDFNKVMHLDPEFKPIVKQEIKKMGDNIRAKHISEKKNYWTSTQEKWEKKLQAKSKKKKEVKWKGDLLSGEVSAGASPQKKDEGQQASDGNGRSEESSGNKDEGQEKKNSQNKEERSLTPSEEKGKTDNKAADKDGNSVQNNAEGDIEDRQKSEIDSRGKETQLTNDIRERKDETANEDEGSSAKPDKSGSTEASGDERLMEQTDMSGYGVTEKRKTSTELRMEKVCVEALTETSSAKPEKSTQSIKRKPKKKKKSILKQ